MNIKGKTVVITGASSGIGAETARIAGKHSANVILLARNQARLQKVKEDILASGGLAECYPVDLADAQVITDCAKQIITEHGAPHVLINNAGAGNWRSILETPASDVEHIMAVPYFAAFNLTRELLPGMIQQKQGHIVNVTSVASKLIWPGSAAYSATRWAINGFNEALRAEVCDYGITTTLAMFGKITSEYWSHNPGSEERLPGITKMVPSISPAEAAKAIINSIEKNQSFILKPRILRLVLWMNTLFPGNTTYLMRKTGWHPDSTIELSKS